MSEVQYHIRVKEGDVGKYVLLPGDPGRCESIANYFDHPKFVSFNREHKVYTGYISGEMVSVVSTGMGCPSTAIAVEELVKIGCHTFIRVGTSGAMQPHMEVGDIAIINAAIRDEGTSRQYLPIEYPAIADLDVINALVQASEKLDYTHYVGVSHTKDSFYSEVEPERMPMAPFLKDRWNQWVAGGAICSEMEASIVFILAGIYRKRAGAVTMIIGSDMDTIAKKHDPDGMIRVAVEALRILITKDKDKDQK
ncbi:MAG: uridine phosphorylase [Chloroflexi bacterium HGW-Chloroflexi-2]|jgi:uridine phosphorylase|nr:MAG: uridine phosphorylase [Chloroflexi bacterium HGW-Chloroflexi-2]